MIFHASIDAAEPLRVAQFLADLWGGSVAPFPAVATGSWIALADDGRGTAIEVYPLGTELVETPGDADAGSISRIGVQGSATHLAIATALERDSVEIIAAAEGWPTKYRRRGGMFGVLEIWIEDRLMIEVLTPAMQAEYRAAMTPANWNEMLAAA